MSAPRKTLVAGSTALVLAAAYALTIGTATPLPESTATHLLIATIPGVEAGTDCIVTTATATRDALATFAPLDAGVDVDQPYVWVKTCAADLDAGEGDGPALPPGMFPLSTTDEVVAYDGGPVLEVWLASDPAAPFACACSTGVDSGCEALRDLPDGGSEWAPVPLSDRPSTLAAGRWRGACRAKPCTEWSCRRSMPAACLPDGGL